MDAGGVHVLGDVAVHGEQRREAQRRGREHREQEDLPAQADAHGQNARSRSRSPRLGTTIRRWSSPRRGGTRAPCSPRRQLGQAVVPERVGARERVVRRHDDEAEHVGMDVAVEVHDAGAIEGHRVDPAGWVLAEVEALGGRDAERVVVDAIEVLDLDLGAHRHRPRRAGGIADRSGRCATGAARRARTRTTCACSRPCSRAGARPCQARPSR